MPDQTLELQVTLEDGQFKVASKNVSSSIKDVNKNTKKTEASSSKLTKELLKMGVGFLSVAKAVDLFKNLLISSVAAASRLQEVTSKFRTVFKGNLDVAAKSVNNLTQNYAMSTREAREYLSTIQDLLVPMGMNADMAARMSSKVVELSADLGSFNNLPTGQVMADIQSALVGNFETMKKYGVVLNETVIRQEAMNMGFKVGKGVIDANIKAQAAYSLMVKGSQAAIGDMARTQNSWANRVKKAKAQMEEFQASMGGPVMNTLNDFAASVDLSGQGMTDFATGLGVITAGAIKAAGAIAKVVKVLSPLTKLIEYNIWAIQQLGKLEGQAGTGFFANIELPSAPGAKKTKGPSIRAGGAKGKKGDEPKAFEEFEKRKAALQEYYGVKLSLEEDDEMREGQRQQRAASLHEQFLNSKLKLDSTYISGAQTLASTAAVFMAEKNKKLFRFGQVLAISQAWINTFLAVTKVMSQLGVYGPAAAGVMITAGALQTRRIAAQKPPEFAVGSVSVPRTMPAMVHQGETILSKPIAEGVRSGDLTVGGPGAGTGQRPMVFQIDGRTFFEVNEQHRDEAAQNLGSDGSFPVDSPY